MVYPTYTSNSINLLLKSPKFKMFGFPRHNTLQNSLQQNPTTASNIHQGSIRQDPDSETGISQQHSDQSAADYLREMFLKDYDTHGCNAVDRYRVSTSLNAPSVSVPAPISGIATSQRKDLVLSISLKDSIKELPLPADSSKVLQTSSHVPAKVIRPRVPVARSMSAEHTTYLTFSQVPTQESPEFTDPDHESNVKLTFREHLETLDGSIEHDLSGSLLLELANAVSSSVGVRAIKDHE